MELYFAKMHGLGNDFMLVDAITQPFQPDAALVRTLADRRHGVGFDQLLIVGRPAANSVDFDYRIFNSDGSETAQCGNGARCFAHFVRARYLTNKRVIRARTTERVVEMRVLDDGRVAVNMGRPLFDPARIPFICEGEADSYLLKVAGRRLQTAVLSLGNPHAVVEVSSLSDYPVAEVGAAMQAQACFPQSVNAGFMQMLGKDELMLRVCERGAGETPACGSGACAAAVAARRRGLTGERVLVRLPGGTLEVRYDGNEVELTGPADHVYNGKLEL